MGPGAEVRPAKRRAVVAEGVQSAAVVLRLEAPRMTVAGDMGEPRRVVTVGVLPAAMAVEAVTVAVATSAMAVAVATLAMVVAVAMVVTAAAVGMAGTGATAVMVVTEATVVMGAAAEAPISTTTMSILRRLSLGTTSR